MCQRFWLAEITHCCITIVTLNLSFVVSPPGLQISDNNDNDDENDEDNKNDNDYNNGNDDNGGCFCGVAAVVVVAAAAAADDDYDEDDDQDEEDKKWMKIINGNGNPWYEDRILNYACISRVYLIQRFQMMTSSNGNIFRVTGPLCGDFTGEFPSPRPVTQSVDVFFDLRMHKRLSKQSWGWRFETPSWSFWRHCNDTKNKIITITQSSAYMIYPEVFCAFQWYDYNLFQLRE